jgi:hypothetical protein
MVEFWNPQNRQVAQFAMRLPVHQAAHVGGELHLLAEFGSHGQPHLYVLTTRDELQS